jgi:hypothetical protein
MSHIHSQDVSSGITSAIKTTAIRLLAFIYAPADSIELHDEEAKVANRSLGKLLLENDNDKLHCESMSLSV